MAKLHYVITGGNRGIGLALVQQTLRMGHDVTVICRHSSTELAALPVRVIAGVEFAEPEQLQQAASEFSANSIDVLIHNAGIFSQETLTDFSVPRIQAQFMVDALAPVLLSQCLLPALKISSKIAMITSRMGSISDNTSGKYYGYRMAKAALNAGSVSLARDLASQQIAVGIYHPGFVQTEMVGFAGDISATESAERLSHLIANLSMQQSGQFFHSNGSPLPW